VEVVTTMAQVMNEQSFWDRPNWLFVFLVCGCCGVGDGAKLVGDGDKKHVIKKLNKIFYCCFLCFLETQRWAI
jgi:hypothetical protein